MLHPKPLWILVFCVGLLAGSSSHSRTKRERSSPMGTVIHYQYVLTPRILAGSLTGDAGEAIDPTGEGLKRKLVYGAGVGIDGYVRTYLALGLNFAIYFKDIPETNSGPFRGFAYSSSFTLRPFPNAKNAPYLQFEFGLMQVSVLDYPDFAETTDLGKHSFFRAGVGLLGYTTGATLSTLMLYYQVVSSKDKKLGDRDLAGPYDVSHFGFELGFGIGLKKR